MSDLSILNYLRQRCKIQDVTLICLFVRHPSKALMWSLCQAYHKQHEEMSPFWLLSLDFLRQLTLSFVARLQMSLTWLSYFFERPCICIGLLLATIYLIEMQSSLATFGKTLQNRFGTQPKLSFVFHPQTMDKLNWAIRLSWTSFAIAIYHTTL